MIQILSRIPPGDLAGVLIVPGSMLVASLLGGGLWLARAAQKRREQEMAAHLLLELLDRGVAPAEITAIFKSMGLEQPPESGFGRARGLFRSRRAAAGGSAPAGP